jgi:hypothetical protein
MQGSDNTARNIRRATVLFICLDFFQQSKLGIYFQGCKSSAMPATSGFFPIQFKFATFAFVGTFSQFAGCQPAGAGLSFKAASVL